MLHKIFFNRLKQVIASSISILLALLVFVGIAVVYAWTEPSQAPPSGNVSVPINVGDATQYKSGALGVGGVFHGYSAGIFDGSMRLTPTSQPSSPVDGMIYYDSSLQKFRCRENGNWKDCVGVQSSSCSNYYPDADGDGYYASAPTTICGGALPTGVYSTNPGNDCYDMNNNAKPGQTGFFSVHRGDFSYDYNCDGTQEKAYAVSTLPSPNYCYSDICYNYPSWRAGLEKDTACGQVANVKNVVRSNGQLSENNCSGVGDCFCPGNSWHCGNASGGDLCCGDGTSNSYIITLNGGGVGPVTQLCR